MSDRTRVFYKSFAQWGGLKGLVQKSADLVLDEKEVVHLTAELAQREQEQAAEQARAGVAFLEWKVCEPRM